jgi:hypothetical protein
MPKNNRVGLRRIFRNVGGTRSLPVVPERARRTRDFFQKSADTRARPKQSRKVSDTEKLV